MIHNVEINGDLPCVSSENGLIVPKCGHFERYFQNEQLVYVDELPEGSEDRSQAIEHMVARFVDAGLCPYTKHISVQSQLLSIEPIPRSRYDHGLCPTLETHEIAKLN